MTFELLPILDLMLALYQKPRNFDRFQDYLKLLQGNTKGDMAVPIGNFNPMAKEHVVLKLTELKQLNAEAVMQQTLAGLTTALRTEDSETTFKVALGLADDLAGGWTNRYTTDYDSKFKLNALINRHFCTPIFWSSEQYSVEIIQQRTLEYGYRTHYWLSHPKPVSLQDHLLQEKAVAKKMRPLTQMMPLDVKTLGFFYQTHQHSTDYPIIFNFFYGDSASEQLGYKALGIKEEMAGFKYANWLAITG
jgi:hypothetical protein